MAAVSSCLPPPRPHVLHLPHDRGWPVDRSHTLLDRALAVDYFCVSGMAAADVAEAGLGGVVVVGDDDVAVFVFVF